MNIYRVTFYGASGQQFKSLIKAKSIDMVTEKIKEALSDDSFYFESEARSRFFRPTNYDFIEIEVALLNAKLAFEDISELDDAVATKIIGTLNSNLLIATAIALSSEAVKQWFWSKMSEGRKEMVMEEIRSMGTVKDFECEEAQQLIMEHIAQLEKQGKIVINN